MRWVKASERLPKDIEDFAFYHWRHGDKVKLDTDLFELADGGLKKIGGNGFASFNEIEWLDESDKSK